MSMAANGLQEFQQLLKNFRELGALAIKGTVALPLFNLWLKFGPPPTAAVAVLTSGMQFLAVVSVFHFWHGKAKKTLNRRMIICAVLFVTGLIASGALLDQFTVRAGPKEEPVVEGYTLRKDVQPLIKPNYPPLEALHDAGYDAYKVWTISSVTIIHILLVACWTATFMAVAVFVSTFLMLQRRRGLSPSRIGAQEC
jgi:hypothetical protein